MSQRRYSSPEELGAYPAAAGVEETVPIRVDAEAVALRFRERLRLFALRRTGDAAAAEDVAQETLRRVLAALDAGRVRDVNALPGFVFQTATHVCQHQARSRSREQRALTRYPSETSRERKADVLSRLVEDERAGAVRRALDRLTPEDRALLRALFYEGRNGIELAETLGISPQALRVRKHRALQRLRLLLGEAEP